MNQCNSSISGACMAVLSGKNREAARKGGNAMICLDFSTNISFMDAFTSALLLPHANMEQFSSIMNKLRETAN